jgi:hypothetical protein
LANIPKTDLSGPKAADEMYRKIWGLKELEKLGFPVPPYTVIDITKDKPENLRDYLLCKIEKVKIPHEVGDRVGVTVRVSMPGPLDKLAKHGGLHVIEESEVLKRVLDKYEEYGPNSKIVIQHTVDAKCSGTILKEDDISIVEAIFGDAPALLEGKMTSYEKWVLHLDARTWEKGRTFELEGEEVAVLVPATLEMLEEYVLLLPNSTYLEWSIAKNGKLYFYEYYVLKVAD